MDSLRARRATKALRGSRRALRLLLELSRSLRLNGFHLGAAVGALAARKQWGEALEATRRMAARRGSHDFLR